MKVKSLKVKVDSMTCLHNIVSPSFEKITGVSLKMTDFWEDVLCSVAEMYRCFTGVTASIIILKRL
jgi:hypothetical protein